MINRLELMKTNLGSQKSQVRINAQLVPPPPRLPQLVKTDVQSVQNCAAAKAPTIHPEQLKK